MSKPAHWTLWSLLCAALLVVRAPAQAQELEPRSFTNIPLGQTFLVLGAARSQGSVAPTPESVLQDLDLRIDIGAVGLAHSFALAGSSAKLDMVASRACYEGSAIFQGEFREGRRCEYLDPSVRLSWNFYGAPALSLEDFRRWEPGLVVGASVQVTAPVGDYDSDQLINAGTNRWSLRPSLGMSYTTGSWHIDLMGSVRLFENNDDFFGGIEVEKDPLYALQSHLTYTFNRGIWFSINANFYQGGETTKDGVQADDELRNSRFGVTLSTPINAHHSLKFYASTGVVTRLGTDFDNYGMAWQYRF